MSLQMLGYSDWFADHARDVLQAGQTVARVMGVDRGSFVVRGEWGERTAEVSGKFRFGVAAGEEMPCVGDWVGVDVASPTVARIQCVLPRRTCLRRKCSGKVVDTQMIAANIDVAFVVQSCHYDVNMRRLDRYLVAVNDGGIEPVVVLSKLDLVGDGELDELTDQVWAECNPTNVLAISNTTGAGLEALRATLVPGRTYCLLGSSGVGKTTLLNRLLGHEAFATNAVSETGEGVHTTSRRQLLALDNGALLIDTPGMRELGLLGTSEGLDDNFSDIGELAPGCRFGDCSHTQEPGCAVRAAVEAGEFSGERYESYLKLRKETEFHDMSYVEKRQKDRAFGRFIKTAHKHGKQ